MIYNKNINDIDNFTYVKESKFTFIFNVKVTFLNFLIIIIKTMFCD